MAITKRTGKLPRRLSAGEDILTGEKFDAMTDQQRAKVFAELEAQTTFL